MIFWADRAQVVYSVFTFYGPFHSVIFTFYCLFHFVIFSAMGILFVY